MKGQGAIVKPSAASARRSLWRTTIELSSGATAGTQLGQGATEYLVLLAVVLIVALVSVALLGFFPGMASDAQITQSKTYWSSASPIAVVEWDAKFYSNTNSVYYLRIRNAGGYPIRITKLLGENGSWAAQTFAVSAWQNISDLFYMAPGEEKFFGSATSVHAIGFSVPSDRYVDTLLKGACSPGYYGSLCAASSICQNSTTSGTLQINEFGFEYIEYIEGQQITKRQVGKPLVIKCS